VADTKLNIIIGATDKASGAIGGVTKSLGSLGKLAGVTVAAGLAATAAAIGAVGVGLGKLAIDAAPLEGIKTAFENLTSSIEGGSQAMLQALRDAGNGMVANTDLMKMYNQASMLVSDQFAQQMPEALQYLSKISAATGDDVGYMLDSIIRGVGRLSPMIIDNMYVTMDMEKAYQDYADTLGITTEEMTKEQQQMALMNQVMEQLKINTESLPEVAGTANQQFEAMKVKFENLKDELGLALLPAFSSLLDIIGGLADKYLPLFVEFFMNDVIPMVQSAITFIGGLVENFGGLQANLGFLQPLLDAFGRFWDENGPRIQEIAGELFRKLIEAGKELYEKVMPWIIEQVQKFADWIDENGPLITEFAAVVAKAFAWIAQAVSDAWDFLLPILGGLIDLVLGLAKTIMQVATGDWAGAWETIKQTAVDVFMALQDAWAAFVDWILGWFGTSWDEVVEVWQNNWDMFVTIIELLWDKVVVALQEFVNEVVSYFEGLLGTWYDIGAGIVSSIEKGINDWWGTLVANVKAKFASLIAFAKSVLGMKSPSKVFFEIGENIAIGLIQGIESKFDDIADTAYEMVEELLKVAGKIGGLFTTAMEEREIGPLADRLEVVNEEIEKLREKLFAATEASEWNKIQYELLGWLEERKNLTNEIAEAEAKLAQIEQQRADIKFLQEQIDLLNLIKEYNLEDMDLLKDLEFGLDADVGALLDAMAEAMKAMIRQAELELGIASPSKVFMNIGKQMMQGIATGVMSAANLPAMAVAGAASGTSNYWNLTINEAGRTVDPARSFQFLQALAGV